MTAASLPFSWELCTQASRGYARIKKLVTVLADELRGAVQEVILPTGLYASQRPEAERVPRLRHQYLAGTCRADSEAFLTRFIDAMDDDPNTPDALASLFDYVSALYSGGIEQCAEAVVKIAREFWRNTRIQWSR